MPESAPRPWDPFYSLVGTGMTAWTRRRFRLSVVGREHLPLRRGTLIAATHRSDDDVPVVCSVLFVEGGLWRSRSIRPHFAARDDLFERGALAGALPHLPGPLRRLLWPARPGSGLARVRVRPFRLGDRARLVLALRALDPATPLEGALPAEAARALADCAGAQGRRPPTTAGEALSPLLAEALWRPIDRHQTPGDALDDFWRERALAGMKDTRGLIALMRSGESLLLFPEGDLSVDGSVGPLRRGVESLVRWGRPARVLPVAVSYDRLVSRRPRVVVSVGAAIAREQAEEPGVLLGAMRRAMPLTAGQAIACHLREGASRPGGELSPADLDEWLCAQMQAAEREWRPVEPGLAAASTRHGRIGEVLHELVARQVLVRLSPERLRLNGDAARRDPDLAWLVREHESARQL